MTSLEIIGRIEAEFKTALKNKEQVKLDVLRLLKTALKNYQIEKRTRGANDELTETEVLKIIKKETKKRKEAIESYQKGNRPDLAAKEAQEFAILKNYAPEEIADEELKNIITEIIKENNLSAAADFGQIMKLTMARVGSRADGKKVSALVKELAI